MRPISANITADDLPSNEAALRLGMEVTIDGAINADGITGAAASITFDDEVQGPVAVRAFSADGDRLTLLVTRGHGRCRPLHDGIRRGHI